MPFFRRRLSLSFLWLSCLTLLFPRLTQAVELHLRNGDRITGVLVGRDNGHILFRSPILGELRVPVNEAVVVETPQTPVESLAGLPPTQSTLPKPETGATAPIGEAKPQRQPWRGKVELGFFQQSGRTDNLQMSFRGDAERKSGPNTYRFEARALYGEQYEQPTSDRYDGLFRFRHEIGPRVFSQLQSRYDKDRVKLIEHNAEQNVGIGYRLVQNSRHEASAGVGVTAQYRSALGVESGISYLGEIFEDYTYRLTGRLTLTQDASVVYSPDERDRYTLTSDGYVPTSADATNYRVRFNTSLQGKMTERVSLNLRFEYEFDNAIQDPKAKVDQRITTSLGYGF